MENRDWYTSYRGVVYIHASKKPDFPLNDAYRSLFTMKYDVVLPETFNYGGIVGKANLVDCVTRHPSKWFVGKYGFVLEDARTLPFVPCRGQLGLYDVPPDLAARLAEVESTP